MTEEKESDLNDFDLYGYTTTLLTSNKNKTAINESNTAIDTQNTESAIQANEQLSSKNPKTNTILCKVCNSLMKKKNGYYCSNSNCSSRKKNKC